MIVLRFSDLKPSILPKRPEEIKSAFASECSSTLATSVTEKSGKDGNNNRTHAGNGKVGNTPVWHIGAEQSYFIALANPIFLKQCSIRQFFRLYAVSQVTGSSPTNEYAFDFPNLLTVSLNSEGNVSFI